jgi:DNA helicase II / ATP-dependent DNA helicase PcrA
LDAFELIRNSASQLHEELVSAGADPFEPLALVRAAIASLDLDFVFLPPGDPALKGAKALLDEQTGTIRCEDLGSPVDRALLIAHEIGHVRIHAGSSACSIEDIDPSRSTEAAPVGLQRVEDYGVRERRELQANVFARELVFPRSLARRMHRDEGMLASTIAERSGLPAALVRQQIFDALLLPAAVPEEPRAGAPVRDDPAQDRAARHRGSPFQLQAGPGTGKTRTLVKRVVSLVDERIDPSAILGLTFSNRAGGELAERVAAALPEAAPRLWIGTFHSFGLDLLRRHGDLIGLPPDPPLFDRSDAIEVLEDILPTLPLKHYRNLWDPMLRLRDVLSGISRAKDEVVGHESYRILAQRMRDAASDDDSLIAAEKCLEVAEIYERYEKAKQDRGAVDFGDLVMLPALLLEREPALAASVRLRHRHVLVDEYQDVNRASVRLVKALAGDGKRLWVVGDARQSIYRFRGASSGNMAAFGTDFPGAVIDRLGVSYRSTRKVINAFSGFANSMSASEGMLPLALEADRGDGSALPEIRRFDTPDAEAEGVAASILELQSAGVKLRDQAVLCRTNAKLDDIASALEVRGIPVLHLGSLFERDDVRDLLALLSLAVDPFGDGLVRVGAMPRYAIPLQDVYRATRRLRELGKPALVGLLEIASQTEFFDQGGAGLKRLAEDLRGLRSEGMAWDYLATYLLDRSGLVREMASRDTVSAWMRSAAIWQFLNFVREQSPVGAGFPIRRTLDRIRQMVLLAEERDLRQVPASALHMDAVRLMTVHGSKGLEFEAVHIPGMTKVSFPTNYQGQRVPPPVGMIADAAGLSVKQESQRSHTQEEECLFFVAMSRARTHLRMYLSRTQENGDARAPSPFLDGLPHSHVHEIASPATLPLPPGTPRPIPIVVQYPAERHVTDARLGLYKKCPRRFLYTHVLGLGGARKPTAFSRTHDCLYRLMDWLAESRPAGPVSVADAEKAFEAIWNERGPTDHAFVAEYRSLATRIIAALIRSGDGRVFRQAEAIEVRLAQGLILVEPDEVAELADGTMVLRRVRTGYRRTSEYQSVDHIEYALYITAARESFGYGVLVEAVHLTDEVVEPVEITDRVIGNRMADASKMLAGIAAGAFPAKTDAIGCARCPHFFICAAVPDGELRLD